MTAAADGPTANSYQSADSDNDYLTFTTNSCSYSSTSTAGANGPGDALFDSFVASEFYSPDQQLKLESERRASAPALRHANTYPMLAASASASASASSSKTAAPGGFLHPSDVFTTPVLTDLHSLSAITASISSASLPTTPALPLGLFSGPATAPLRPISYSELPGLDSTTPADLLLSAFESYLNTPVNATNIASPSVVPAQKAMRGEAPLFAPLDEIKSKGALAALLDTPVPGSVATAVNTPMVADSAEDVLEQFATADPRLRQNLVHALVDLIKPATAYQSVGASSSASLVSSASAPQLSALAHSSQERASSRTSGEAPLIDSLLGLLSPPVADVATPALMDTASPALLELLSPAMPAVMAPEDVFKTPRLPTISEEDDDDDMPLAETVRGAIRPVLTSLVSKLAPAPAKPAGSKRKHMDDDEDDDDEQPQGKRFHCDICNRGFSRQYNMRTHKLTHDPSSNAARPFNCSHCHRTFTRKHDLTRHQVLHDDSNAFKCSICSRGFARLDVLERHARAVHKSE